MERKHKDIKVHMVNAFKTVERTVVYNYLNATITAMITGHIQFVDEYLLDPQDDRSSNAVLPGGKVCKGDMVVFKICNPDTRARQALGKVEGFLQSDGCLFAHLIQFKPCSHDCGVPWDASQHHETIVVSDTIVCPVPYKLNSADTIRIIPPAMF